MRFLLCLLVLGLVGCVEGVKDRVSVGASDEIRLSLRETNEVFVYEGLPHQAVEHEALETELKRKDVRELSGFPFYTPKVRAEGQVGEELKKLLSSRESLQVFVGEKKCGGFHPDYAVAWGEGKEERLALICFGCGEILFVGPEGRFRYDMNGVEEELRELLKGFSKNRPKRGF